MTESPSLHHRATDAQWINAHRFRGIQPLHMPCPATMAAAKHHGAVPGAVGNAVGALVVHGGPPEDGRWVGWSVGRSDRSQWDTWDLLGTSKGWNKCLLRGMAHTMDLAVIESRFCSWPPWLLDFQAVVAMLHEPKLQWQWLMMLNEGWWLQVVMANSFFSWWWMVNWWLSVSYGRGEARGLT